MNMLDDPHMSGMDTPPAQQPEQSLNEEVSQVMGQLGRFWGGLRKQSQTALEVARRDLGEVVSQAQRELGKLTGEGAARAGEEEESTVAETSSSSESATSSTERELSSSSVFWRLPSALGPQLVSSVQNHLPETLKQDLGQLRSTLSTELQRVQGATMAQAGEYMQRSEGLLREVGEVLRDAVKVVPPEEAEVGMIPPGPLWDGVETWTVPSSSSSSEGKGKGKGKEGTSSEGETPVKATTTTRAESLLKQLKHHPGIIRHDPMADERVREVYRGWVEAEVEGKGGVEGDEWSRRIAGALDGSEDGLALQASLDALVPAEMTREEFWKRYMFRVHQIEREEEKRRALLRGSTENEEVFSWEDEEEEGTQRGEATATSPRESESSYDVVSSRQDEDSDWE